MIENNPFASASRKLFFACFLSILFGSLSAAHAAHSITLAWNASSGAAGYELHYGNSSAKKTQISAVGNVLQATISNLAPGQTYFFDVTAYNAAGTASAPSNEVSFKVAANPVPTPTPTPTPKPTPTPTPTPKPTPTPTPKPIPTPTPKPTPTPGSTPPKIVASLFKSTDVPAKITDNDSNSVELGVQFQPLLTGQVTAIRFYKGPQNTGLHTGHLWNSSGALLATVVFTNESGSGWQQANLASAVTLTAGANYVVSYHTDGFYSDNEGYFSGPHTSGPLTAKGGSNGVYAYGSSIVFPTSTYNSTNYWVDVLYATASVATPTPTPTPTPTSSLFTAGDTPATVTVNDSNSVELGVKFQTSTTRQLIGFRFYKGPSDTGYHIGHLWNSSGALLASAVFKNETASGWQQASLANPVTLTPGTTYIVSYFSNGYYPATDNYFATSHASGSLTAPSDSASGGNGVYSYGDATTFPTNSYDATNYWIDVLVK
jgi:uncharacterized protein DUF4082/fibronectin type III domain protein